MLASHHSRSMPAKEAWQTPAAGTVLRGPKWPHWGCSRCGEGENWASRLACKQCGKAASQATADRARAEAKKAMDKPAVPHSRRVAMSDDARRPRSYASVAAAAKDPHAKALERDAGAIKVLEEKLAAAKLAYKHAPRTQRGRSGSTRREGRGRSTSRRPADATTTPGDGFAVVERRRRKSRAQRQESAGGLTGSVKSLATENAVLKRQLAEVARPAADVTMTGETDAAAATG